MRSSNAVRTALAPTTLASDSGNEAGRGMDEVSLLGGGMFYEALAVPCAAGTVALV